MGKSTKSFRQTGKSMSGSQGARNYSPVQRDPWHQKVWSYIVTKGKGGKQIGS